MICHFCTGGSGVVLIFLLISRADESSTIPDSTVKVFASQLNIDESAKDNSGRLLEGHKEQVWLAFVIYTHYCCLICETSVNDV